MWCKTVGTYQDSVELVTRMPWNLYKDHVEADGDIPEHKIVDVERENEERGRSHGAPPVVVVKTRQVAPRALQVSRADAGKHGHTGGCVGCPVGSEVWGVNRAPSRAGR